MKVEFLCYGKKDGDWRQVEMAINGILVIPFSVHESDWRCFSTPQKRDQFLVRQAQSLIDEYGDARNPRARREEYAQA